jgi:hypothetical protein
MPVGKGVRKLRCRNCAAYLTENKENGIKGTVFSCGENFFSMRCEKRISG